MIKESFEYMSQKAADLPPIPPEEYSPLVLAYLGDAVLELYVRTRLVQKGNMPVHQLHIKSSRVVSAKAQSAMLDTILPELTEEELRIFKRGRNAKSYSGAKNASSAEYHRSTGLESLLGYLFLKQQHGRIVVLVEKGLGALLDQ